MNSFRDWYIRNQDAITWFLIGLLTAGMVEQLSRGDYFWAAVSAALVVANYKMSDFKMR